MNTTRMLDELAQVGISLLLQEPFYAHLLSGLNKQIVGTGHPVDSMGVSFVSGGHVLYVNERFWSVDLVQPEHRRGVLKHELLHLVFRHIHVEEPRLDRHLMNIAFDLVVNQFVDKHHLPEDSIFLETFPNLDLAPGQTWFYYYKKLEDVRNGGAGEEANTPSRVSLGNIKADSHGLDRHQGWEAPDGRSELEKHLADSQLDALIRRAGEQTSAHAWGNLPSDIRTQIQNLVYPTMKSVDWKRVLKLFVGASGKTRIRHTIKRPSKRYGTIPGLCIRRRQRFLIAIDTSGSIRQHDLDVFFSEVHAIWRAGAMIDVVECDTHIQRRYPYRGRMPDIAQGRGGTNFDAPIALASLERPDGLFYFTDGFGPSPGRRPTVPLLWVITGNGLDASHPQFKGLPGRKVRL
jgi:predicted metal-dependent peptidase